MKINLEDIQVISSHLYFGEEFTNSIEEDKLKWAEEEIVSSANQMKTLLRDPVENIAFAEDFPMTEDVSVCKKCNFRKACEYPM